MFDTDEFTEVEGRYYVNPQTALDESNDFITNLRNTQEANTQQIKTDTYNLGTAVPSNLGGLTGAESYFTSRYQTPQTASAVANLRATAQAAALNQVLENEQAIWKKRYQDAYRKYQKSAYDKANNPTTTNPDGTAGQGDYESESTSQTVGSVEPSFSPLDFSGEYVYEYTPGGLNASGGFNAVNSLGAGSALGESTVYVTRDSSGNVTSLTVNGKTFTGDAAEKRYSQLEGSGTLTGGKK